MCKNFYYLLIQGKINKIDFFECFDIAKEHGKVQKIKDVTDFGVNEPAFIELESEDNQVTNECIFYDNLMISLYRDFGKDDKIIRIHMKCPEDTWTFNSTATEDILKPTNTNAEIYIKYDVSVLKLNRCYGEDYKSGSWNKMFYKSIRSFPQKVMAFTEINKISEAYNDRRSKKEN